MLNRLAAGFAILTLGCTGSMPGSSSGSGGFSLAMEPNPKSVLSAEAWVSWTPGMASLRVQVTDSAGNDAGVTPVYPVGLASPQLLPVLGLAALTTYSFEAKGWFVDGGCALTAPQGLTTGSPPGGVPYFEVTYGQASGPYTLLAIVPSNAGLGIEYLTVVDPNGRPVWYIPLPDGYGNVGDCQQQPDGTYTASNYNPQTPILGLDGAPSVYEQYDCLGNYLRTWTSPDSTATDGHDLRILADGTALLYGLNEQPEELATEFDGGKADAGVWGYLFERLAPDGGVLFSWNIFDYIPVTDVDPAISMTTSYVDPYHANAIDITADGNYLLNIRDTDEVVKVNSTTGDVLWILGGPRSTFTFVNDPKGHFDLQHGARELPNGDILLFDDGNDHTPPFSRAVEYALDTNLHTATLVWSSQGTENGVGISSYALGYAQRLDNGNTLITYGTARHVQEVTADGGLVWDLYDPTPDFGIYRAYRLNSLYGPNGP